MIDRDDPRLTAYALGEADAETLPVVEQALQYSDALRRDETDIREMGRLLSAALQSEAAPALRPEQRRAVVASVVPVPVAAAPAVATAPPTASRRLPSGVAWTGLAAALIVALWVSTRGTRPAAVQTVEAPASAAGPGVPPLAPPSATPVPPAHVPSAVSPSEAVRGESAGTVTVRGLVKDASGAAVGGATIVVNDLDTGVTRSTASGAQGTFEVAGVPAGRLYAQAVLPGFPSRRSADFKAGAGTTVIWNPTLEAGSLAETVTVVDALPLTQASSAAVSAGVGAAPPAFMVRDRDPRRAPDAFGAEAYAHRQDSDFVEVALHPLSTLSVDVDTASYSNVRRFLNEGRLPPPDAVRIEEMVNYFPYDYPAPVGGEVFAAHVETAPAPWKPEHRLLRLGLRSRDVSDERRPPANLVFLIDVSGSMNEPNKLPLVQRALKMLVKRLDGRDRVGLVVYAGEAGLVLPSTSAGEQDVLLEAIDRLRAGGSTNGGEGIELAYEIASREFVRGGVNRVVLATDGDFNVGVTDEGSLVRLVQDKARTGVFLTVLGFGMGNLQDSRLEALADKGNGSYAYVDTENEARKALVDQMTSTLVTVAKDVKIQVEFNPARVRAYRLIGYENRLLRPEDFRDDQKDAGEVGAGHAVTALYEIVPPGVPLPRRQTEPLRYQRPGGLSLTARGGELMRVKVSYQEPQGAPSQVREWPVMDLVRPIERTSPDFKFAAAVAQFGMILRHSPHQGRASLSSVLALADAGRAEDAAGYRAEFAALVKRAQELTPGDQVGWMPGGFALIWRTDPAGVSDAGGDPGDVGLLGSGNVGGGGSPRK